MLKVKERPDKQAPVFAPLEMVIDEGLNRGGVEHLKNARLGIIKATAHEIDAFALEPAGVRRAETLFDALGYYVWRGFPMRARTFGEKSGPAIL